MLAGNVGLRNKRIVVIFCLGFVFAFACLLFFSSSPAGAADDCYIGDDYSASGSVEKEISAEVEVEPFAEVKIEPDHTGEGSPTETVNYAHLIVNRGNTFDTFDITYTSSLGWTYKFFTDPNGDGDPADGVELTDTDGDGLVDTGVIDHCDDTRIVKQVKIPQYATPGSVDTMIITVRSSFDSVAVDDATNLTKVIPPFTTFGEPTPTEVSKAITGGVLPFTGAVLISFFLCGGILIAAGLSISRRNRMTFVRRR